MNAEENEIIDLLHEIARLRRALANIKGICDSEMNEKVKLIAVVVKETLGTE